MWKSISLAALVACSSSPPQVPTGEHHAYVIDHLYVPTNNVEARQYALDVGGDTAVDNELGMAFGTASSMGFDTAVPTQAAVTSGAIALVADLQTPDFTTATAAGFTLVFGQRQPDGSYTLAPDSPADVPVVGPGSDGKFSLVGGELAIRIAFIDPALVITLPLEHARVELGGASDAGIASGVIAGAVRRDALDTLLLPPVAQAFDELIAHDCGHGTTTACNCLPGSAGETLIDQFDTSPADCTITGPELARDTFIQALLAPDLRFDGVSYVSVGVGFTAVATRLD